MKNKRAKIQEISLDAMFLALILLMTFTPIGFIAIPPVSATLIRIPVLIGAYLFGRRKGAIYGLFFGVMSMTKAYQSPTSILDPYFQNPFISILPRVLFGYVSGFVFERLRLHIKSTYVEKITSIFFCFFLTMLHSVFVFTSLAVFYATDMNAMASEASYASYWAFVGIILLTQSTIEGALASIIVPAVSFPIDRYALKGLLIHRLSTRKKEKVTEQKNSEIVENAEVKIVLDKDEKEKEIMLHIKKDER